MCQAAARAEGQLMQSMEQEMAISGREISMSWDSEMLAVV